MTNKDCFYKVTNEQIYNKLISIEKKCTIAVWTASTAFTLSLISIGVIVIL